MQSFIQAFGAEGTIINLVSLAATLPSPGASSYSSTKLAMINLGQNLSLGICPIAPSSWNISSNVLMQSRVS